MRVVWQRVGMRLGTCSGPHMWMGLSSVSAGDNNAMGATGGVGIDEGDGLIGMGTGESCQDPKKSELY
jgi:hypothetical protein